MRNRLFSFLLCVVFFISNVTQSATCYAYPENAERKAIELPFLDKCISISENDIKQEDVSHDDYNGEIVEINDHFCDLSDNDVVESLEEFFDVSDNDFESAIVPDYYLEEGDPAFYECNGKSIWIAINLIAGKTYHIYQYGDTYSSIGLSLYTKDNSYIRSVMAGQYEEGEVYGFYYVPDSTEQYFLKIYFNSSKDGVYVGYDSKRGALKKVSILSSQYNDVVEAGTYYGNYVLPEMIGLSFRFEFENGEIIDIDRSDIQKKGFSISYDYLYDENGEQVGERIYYDEYNYDDVYQLVAGKDYYIKVVVSGYSGNLFVKITAKSKEDLTVKVNQKFKMQSDKDRHECGSAYYYMAVENGKTYIARFVDFYDSVCEYGFIPAYYKVTDTLCSPTYKVKELGSAVETVDGSFFVFTADFDGSILFYVHSFKASYKLPEESYIMVSEFEPTLFNFLITKAPTKSAYSYGSYPSPEGVEITMSYGSDVFMSTYDIFSKSESWEGKISADVYSLSKKPIKKDENWNIPIGTYIWGYSITGLDYVIYDTDNMFTIVESDKEYKILFHSNYPEGTIEDVIDTQFIEKNKQVSLKRNSFNLEGYTFLGWSTQKDGSVTYLDNCKVYNLSGEEPIIELYAIWEITEYKISWHLSGGKIVDGYNLIDKYTVNSSGIALPVSSNFEENRGYVFEGWYTSKDYTTKASDIAAGSIGDKDFYAKWKAKEYKICFEGNGNRNGGSMSTQTVMYGAKTKINKVLYKDDRAFMGWAFSSNGTAEISNQALFDIKDYIDHADEERQTITFYAVWQDKFAIAKNLDGGTFKEGESIPEYYEYGKKLTLPNPVRTGYTFAGWYNDNSGSKLKELTAKIVAPIVATGKINLVARWTPITYGIKFAANGGTGKMSLVSVKYDEEKILPACNFIKKGYAFKGWINGDFADDVKAFETTEALNAFAAGKTIYNDKEVVKNLTDSVETVKLAAIWVKTKYTVTFETYGGTAIDSKEYEYSANSASFELPADPAKEGYTFGGWYTDEKLTKKVESTKGIYGDVIFYAKWKADYKVVFHAAADDATGTMSDQFLKYGTSKALSKNKFKRDGYVFMGWATAPEAKTVVYANRQKIKGKDGVFELNLYAVWEQKFGIEYEENGGTLAIGSPEEYIFGDEVTLLEPTREGYKFGGWYRDPKFKKQVKKITKKMSGDIILYAKWTGRKYTVKFESNVPEGLQGSGKMKKQTLTYGTAKALTKNGFKIKGYSLKGWATTPDGEVVFANGAKVSDKETPELSIASIGSYADKLTLYAVWEKDSYIVTYKMGGVIDDVINENAYDVDTGYRLVEPEGRLGYTFLGFYTDKKCKKKAKDLKAGTTGNKTFYAKWKINR